MLGKQHQGHAKRHHKVRDLAPERAEIHISDFR